jgi:hypothetical protein
LGESRFVEKAIIVFAEDVGAQVAAVGDVVGAPRYDDSCHASHDGAGGAKPMKDSRKRMILLQFCGQWRARDASTFSQ